MCCIPVPLICGMWLEFTTLMIRLDQSIKLIKLMSLSCNLDYLFRKCSISFDSFMPIHTGAETDLRFLYCAGKGWKISLLCFLAFCSKDGVISYHYYYLIVSAAISFMLDNWSGMDKEKAKNYILRCQVCGASSSTILGFTILFVIVVWYSGSTWLLMAFENTWN